MNQLEAEFERQTKHRQCETMLDMINGNIEQNALDAWKNSPLLKSKVMHNAFGLGDPTAGLIDIATRAIEAVRPDAIGRMCVNLHETRNEKLKIRMRDVGQAARTKRGNNTYVSYAGRNTFIEAIPNKEIEVSDTWDRADFENSESSNWNIQAESMVEMARDLMDEESRIIINFIDSVTTADTAGLITKSASTDLSADLLIQGWSKAKAANQRPNVCMISTKGLGQLLLDDDFKDQTMLGPYADYTRGMMGQFLGMQILFSSLVPEDKAYILDKDRAVQYVLRRDSLMVPYDMPPNQWGLNVSTRYDIQFGDKKSIVPIRAA